jgi:hypothetical protein
MAQRKRPTNPPPDTQDQTPKAKRKRKSSSSSKTGKPGGQSAELADPHINGKSNGHSTDPTLVSAPPFVPAIVDTFGEPAPLDVGMPSGGGENIEDVAVAIGAAALEGVQPAKELAGQLPGPAARDVVLSLLPDDWRDADAFQLLTKLPDADIALILAWLTAQWWHGYGAGQEHRSQGLDLRAP